VKKSKVFIEEAMANLAGPRHWPAILEAREELNAME